MCYRILARATPDRNDGAHPARRMCPGERGLLVQIKLRLDQANFCSIISSIHIHIESQIMRTVEAIIDEEGVVHFVEPVGITGIHRALVTIFDDDRLSHPCETAQLSEKVLAEDWDNPGEDDAWKHLQQAQ